MSSEIKKERVHQWEVSRSSEIQKDTVHWWDVSRSSENKKDDKPVVGFKVI